MDHEMTEIERKWAGRILLGIRPATEEPTAPPTSPLRESNTDVLPSVIELTPPKAKRAGSLRMVRSEPRKDHKRSSSSGNGPRIPKNLFTPKNERMETLRRRKKSSSPQSRTSLDTNSNHPVRNRPRSRYVIPAEHPLKLVWDILTVIFAIAHTLKTHQDIRDRQFAFGASPFKLFCDVWFFIDILLNFVSERRAAEGYILRDYRSICARYLTSWFPVDVLSLFPWETLFVQPIIEIQNKRGPLRKVFFRSRAVINVIINKIRVRHFRWFGNVAKHTKHHGIGSARLLRLLIKYLPKYGLFFQHMKGVVAMRVLRQVHWLRRFFQNIDKSDGSTVSLSKDGSVDDISSRQEFGSDEANTPPTILDYEDWELIEDDGVPL
eukprot:scaffold24878_cov147-Cylindrotheca_fusiformis.AAC.3